MFLIQKRTPQRQTSQSKLVPLTTNAKILRGREGPKNLPQVSIGKWILDHLIKYHNKILIVDAESGREWTGRQLHDYAYNLAISLIEKFGLQKGDPVCFYAPTQPSYIIALIAVWMAGGVFTGCDPLFPEFELYNVIEDTNSRYIITSRQNLSKAESVAAKFKTSQLKHLIIIEDLEQYFTYYDKDIYYITYYDSNNESLPNSSKSLSAVMFTSGTTGRPKPIIREHADLVYVSMELQDADLLGVEADDCVAFNLPVFHSAGLYYLLHFLIAGCKMACFSGYDESTFLAYVQKYKVSIAFLLHSRVRDLVIHQNTYKYDLSSLKEIFYDGANLAYGIASTAFEKFSLKYIRQIAGQSEIGWIAIFPRSLSMPETKSVGPPAPGLEIKVVDIDSGRMVEANRIGEICVKSQHCAKCYYNRSARLTSDLFDSDGFVKTGDAGYYDERGYLYHVDRICWLIKVDGNIIIASQLEELIRSHTAVSEVAVLPVKSGKYGQIPKAFVTLNGNCDDVTEQTIIDYVAKNVDKSYKQLRGGVVFLNQMPISPNGRGRIRKAVLLQML